MSPPPRNYPSVVDCLKDAYFLWISYFVHLPNIHKYSLGENVSKLFVETIEMTVYASFLPPKEKLPYIKVAVRKTDTIKVFLQLIWEMKIWDDKTYLTISERMSKAGQQLGGWHNKMEKTPQTK